MAIAIDRSTKRRKSVATPDIDYNIVFSFIVDSCWVGLYLRDCRLVWGESFILEAAFP